MDTQHKIMKRPSMTAAQALVPQAQTYKSRPTRYISQDPALSIQAEAELPSHDFNERFTVIPGISISTLSHDSSGTLGAIVYKNGSQMLLTNRHVVINEENERNRELLLNRVKYNKLRISERLLVRIQDGEMPVFHPPYQGGNTSAKIIAFVTETCSSLDAALCELVISPEFVKRTISGRDLAHPTDPGEGETVFKFGATTKYREGVIVQVSGNTILIRDNTRRVFAEPGDSGSLVVEAERNRPVGLYSRYHSETETHIAFNINAIKDTMEFSFIKEV